MSQVRFQVLFGPASLHPQRMGWSLPAGNWYGWRLMGANNRELGRSALSFVTLAPEKLADGAVTLQDRRAPSIARLSAGGVMVSGEQLTTSGQPTATGAPLSAEAELADSVVAMHDRRSFGVLRQPLRGVG